MGPTTSPVKETLVAVPLVPLGLRAACTATICPICNWEGPADRPSSSIWALFIAYSTPFTKMLPKAVIRPNAATLAASALNPGRASRPMSQKNCGRDEPEEGWAESGDVLCFHTVFSPAAVSPGCDTHQRPIA